ncbi:MAG: DUF554 domain-containing protein [Erysipelotrichaceae bacterium]
MPIGIITNCLSVFLGGLLGASGSKYIPERLKTCLPIYFGFGAICIGIIKIPELQNLSIVILALILGAIIGEGLCLHEHLQKGAQTIIEKCNKVAMPPEKLHYLVLAIVVFCASGTGLFGAIQEGLTHDPSILLSKSILDFFTAMIFASIAGYGVAVVAGLQAIVFALMFVIANLSAPYLTTYMVGNFMAVGGLLTLIVGCNMTKMVNLKVANAIPALFIVVLLSLI